MKTSNEFIQDFLNGNDAIRKFLSGYSEEIKLPLNSIFRLVRRIKRQQKPNVLPEDVRSIRCAIKDMERTIQNLKQCLEKSGGF
jgi:hypothetical protein